MELSILPHPTIHINNLQKKLNATVVIDGPFQTKSGVQIGVQAMTSCVTIIYAYLKKRNISVFLEIMLFSNLWEYGIFSLVDNVHANLIALTKSLVY